jgi:cell division septum initiation protein DivIVA
MNRNLEKFLKLRTALVNERAKLEARLAEVSKTLGQAVSATESSPASTAPATTTTKGKRAFSEAAKAKMRAAQRARWAKLKGSATAAPAAPKKKRKMSAAGRAAIVAAAKARWARVKATAWEAGK